MLLGTLVFADRSQLRALLPEAQYLLVLTQHRGTLITRGAQLWDADFEPLPLPLAYLDELAEVTDRCRDGWYRL